MSYEYNGPHNLKTIERLDRWTNQRELYLSSISQRVTEQVNAALKKGDRYFLAGKEKVLKFRDYFYPFFGDVFQSESPFR